MTDHIADFDPTAQGERIQGVINAREWLMAAEMSGEMIRYYQDAQGFDSEAAIYWRGVRNELLKRFKAA